MKEANREGLLAYARDHFPSHIPVDPPRDLAEARGRREMLHGRYKEVLGDLPTTCDLEEKIVHRRRYRDHIETKIVYQAEADAWTPACLLVPRSGTPPFSAVIAHHQCRIDCDWGKEAVVGKVVERQDQAYGLELVRRGFVVLAPDAINCGENNIVGLRDEGDAEDDERWKHCHCWGATFKHVSTKHLSAKRLHDSVRAIDYLTALEDLVDPKRIAMIGHSLGAGTTGCTAAFDPRVRAAVTSAGALVCMGEGHGWGLSYTKDRPETGIWPHEMIELTAPRALFTTTGREEVDSYEDPQRTYDALDWLRRYALYIYSLYGREENFHLEMFDAGHVFPDDVRSKAYSFIEKCLTE